MPRVAEALIYDWNTAGTRRPAPSRQLEINDETLRDGLQSPSVIHPPVERKRAILHLMEGLGIDSANIGYPGAGQRALDDVAALATEIRDRHLRIQPNCAGRTVEADIISIAEAQQRAGIAIEAALFLGSSPIRQYVEGWDIEFLLRTADSAVTFARRLGLEVMFVTEDTTRARPEHLRRLYGAAVSAGARRICLADTVGHATPWGVQRLVRYMRRVIGPSVLIDWHGHRDRGLDVINSLVAAASGADRLHACALGIGERVGNTSMDQLLVNLKLLGWFDADLRLLPDYCRTVADAVGLPIPPNVPILGKDAFETSTGVHAAAILKALRRGDRWLADRVYSGVPAEAIGREQRITIGPMSGQANVLCWCERHGIAADPDLVGRILDRAKSSDRVLRDDEIFALVMPQAVEAGGGSVSLTLPTATERRLLLGNHAIARGAYEAGVAVAAAYPGTPSTEILEALATQKDVYVEWATNEKVALDVAVGAAIGGVRALMTTKHVGLNVAADTLMVAAYTGVGAGLVIVCADDPGMHSSQNEQDNRLYARFAGIPMLEPGDAAEAKAYTAAAFDLSEAFDTPVLVRTTTRVSHGCGIVPIGERHERPPRGFRRDPGKFVMLPSYARDRHPVLLERLARLAEAAETSPMNATEMRDRRIGVVTAGIAYHYVREVLPDASVLKLGLSFPLPMRRIREFAASVDRLFIVEELEPFIEDTLRAGGVAVEGKAFFPRVGELTPDLVRQGFIRAGVLEAGLSPSPAPRFTSPRPPVLCPGCPHTVPYMALRRLGAVVAGDIGCYTLAALEPLAAIDTCLAMGCSIGMAIGLARSRQTAGPVVATIGDSTFLHAGVPALLDAVYNKTPITVVILDNGTTAMTGGQPHPGTGRTIRDEGAPRVDVVTVCRALGVEWVQTVDPYDVGATHRVLEAAIAHPGPSVVVTTRPCVEAPAKIRERPFTVVAPACTACQACVTIGCPAIAWSAEWHEGRPKVTIDQALCSGCTICAQVCPTGAIVLADSPPPVSGDGQRGRDRAGHA